MNGIVEFAKKICAVPWVESEVPYPVEIYTYAGTGTEGAFSKMENVELIKDEKTFSGERDDTGNICTAGYDIETTPVADEFGDLHQEIVSHQFYWAHAGARKALLLMTSARFTEAELVEFLATIASEDPRLAPIQDLQMYLSAHFSLYEGGWLIEGGLQ